MAVRWWVSGNQLLREEVFTSGSQTWWPLAEWTWLLASPDPDTPLKSSYSGVSGTCFLLLPCFLPEEVERVLMGENPVLDLALPLPACVALGKSSNRPGLWLLNLEKTLSLRLLLVLSTLQTHYVKCGPQASSVSLTWEVVEMQSLPQAPPRPTGLEFYQDP